jgi:hypothetical protein
MLKPKSGMVYPSLGCWHTPRNEPWLSPYRAEQPIACSMRRSTGALHSRGCRYRFLSQTTWPLQFAFGLSSELELALGCT